MDILMDILMHTRRVSSCKAGESIDVFNKLTFLLTPQA